MRNTVSLAVATAIAIAVPSLAPRISNVSGVQGDGGGGGGQAPLLLLLLLSYRD